MDQITLEIQKLEEGPYLGTSPDLPGLIVQGASPEEVVELAPDIARALIRVMLKTGEALPPGLRPLATPTRVPLVVPARPMTSTSSATSAAASAGSCACFSSASRYSITRLRPST